MYIPVSMDTVDADTIWGSFKNLYKQQRRWAWGVEHFPYLLLNFGRNKKITWKMKFKYIWNLGEGMYSWATAPLIIFILGKLPLYMLSKTDESSQVLVQNTPFILEKLLTFAMIGIFASAILSLLLLPPMPEDKQGKNTLRKFGFWMFLPYSTFSLSRRERKIVRSYTIMLFQWMLLPVTLVLFGSIPAIDAQTRLMINKPLGFFNTPKKR